MKRITLIILFMTPFLCLASQTPNLNIDDELDVGEEKLSVEERLEYQRQRFEDIEQVAAGKLESIQKQHLKGKARVWQRAKDIAKRLEPLERRLWVEFFKIHKEAPYTDLYFERMLRRITYLWDKGTSRLQEDMKESYFIHTAAEFLLDDDAELLLKDIEKDRTQSQLLRVEARKVLDLMSQLRLEQTQLDTRTELRFGELEAWKQKRATEVQNTIDFLQGLQG